MDYTLTRIDPDGENDRYPLQKQEVVDRSPGTTGSPHGLHG
jgi:hypothetical protein